MKTLQEVVNLLNVEMSQRRTRIQELVQNLQSLKNKQEITEQMKVELIKYATEIQEHRGVINTLQGILNKIGQ